MLSKGELEYRCRLSKSINSLGPIESEGSIINNMNKNIPSHSDSYNSSYSTVDDLVGIRNFVSDDTFLVRDSNSSSYSIYLDIENQIFEIDNDPSFVSELESSFYSFRNSTYQNNISKNDDSHYDRYMYDTKYSWNNHINSCIDSYLRTQICIDSYILSGSHNYSDSYINSDICGEGGNSSESESFSIRTSTHGNNLTITESSNDLDNDRTTNYSDFWVICENCHKFNYKRLFKSKMNICEECGYHLKMNSSDRIELLIDPGTWEPMDEDMVSVDPIEWDSEVDPIQWKSQVDPIEGDSEVDLIEGDSEEYKDSSYKDRISSSQIETGLPEAIQTGTGKLNGIPVAIGVMEFEFMGGSMGSVVGEKITRLIDYASNQFLPLILVCASGGARMQEGSLSLMQMAKISSALYDYKYQSNKKLFYVAILTSPTTGGVTASFAMLGDIIIAEPNAYIAFAGKRIIEETLKMEVPEGSQKTEPLFEKGLLDLIVPRNPLKDVVSELFQLHAFVPSNQNSIK